jgi:bifunctional DNase/RNase
MVGMNIKGLVLDPVSQKPIAVLETVDKPHRLLPIWIGRFEANAIALEMEKVPPLRPLTHDLIKSILQGLDAKVHRIIVTKLESNIFFAVIDLELNGREITVDSRPSDAIAVALRVDAPIFATEQVLEAAQSIEVPDRQEAALYRGAFGMTVQALTPAIAEHFSLTEGKGVLVSHIQLNSKAHSSGIRRGDIITTLGEHQTGSLQDFEEAVKAIKGQERVAVNLRRGEARHDITLRLGPSSD